MNTVVIVGTGNVALQLYTAMSNKEGVKIIQVIGRNKKKLTPFKNCPKTSTDYDNISDANIYIIAVNDDSISTVSQHFKNKSGLVVHTSGSMPLSVLPKSVRRGVFYPLQTISKDRNIDFSEVPICIEAEKSEDYALLRELASTISTQIQIMTSDQRKSVHLAAVFVNNFTNHLYHIGNEICNEAGVPFTILNQLVLETAKKATETPVLNAQTGPAVRNDKLTMKEHLVLLNNKDYRDIYSVLSNSIQKTHEKKL
ncbi:Rossmann-like and DUF2520 domain-containing protein [uncultured Eudoraea sp.]|uniref:Rossmann-like and DUF2520 domain-containing protein n=1 Tax=uncultured Eudoraea sp. TaxID=1035614 RepID=UPI0026033C8F|nr:DUF2520 domain-containing protein [uncultured Eudoraea sp.]